MDIEFKDQSDEEYEAGLLEMQKQAEEETRKRFEALKKEEPAIKERIHKSTEYKIKSGLPELDKAIDGFESERTYILGGAGKTGKSTYLMNILDNMLRAGVKIGYLDTELGYKSFVTRFCAVSNSIHERSEKNTQELKNEWQENFIDSGLLQYCFRTEIHDKNLISLEKIKEKFQEWQELGVQVFIIDNITTVRNEGLDRKAAHVVLTEFVQGLKNYAQIKNIILILVLHTYGIKPITELGTRINKIIQEKTPLKLLEDSVEVQPRPSKSDLYGGEDMLSQISGGVMLLWTPFRSFNDPNFRKVCQLILTDWRSEPVTFKSEIPMVFNVETSRYREISELELAIRKEPVSYGK